MGLLESTHTAAEEPNSLITTQTKRMPNTTFLNEYGFIANFAKARQCKSM